ncbi:phenylalanine--tRNA ligase subunit beta [Lutimonas zeaxanthinifaciens]|uniref:phenylalanine--tRNA ligase subunit beta n=1 Tax=Lutimonas zeaxanthinifaciens TaxID=3060215 RepID=UPI00265CF9A5|nr:phenylalanine--tRNA ligase subunit beta [Lutimonas sp. YSD2104]WKK65077.1 phenylalanine--tRNA ligase subunit beta [Lutimonas sp. YSD2104]
MKISYNWLKEFLNIDLDVEKVSEILTDLGLEVEGIESYESVKGNLKGVVVGEVLSCEQHPNADRLKVTQVDLGNGSPVQIVCGAPNVAKGQKVPVATIGTVLYTDQGEDFKIKKGKIRGEFSHGMICAEDELGLGESHDGIMVLPEDTKVGAAAADIFDLYNDKVIEIGLTPNRADAMSHLGVARDLYAGLLQMEEMQTKFNTPSVSDFHVDERTFNIKVEVDDYEQVPRYAGITITDLKIEESPAWLQNKLKAIGLGPINNVVDITNYILHGLGQPLHAFDADKIKGGKVVVKNLSTGTKFVGLDGVERELHEDDIMICDGKDNPMCIGGVFGGLNSGVTEETKSIFLEAAYFNPVSIRKTAKRHGLNTDASFRFERGINPNSVVYALKRAAIWIAQLANGKIVSDVTDLYPNKIEDFQVNFSYEKAFKLIGEEISTDTIKDILASLDIKINHQTPSGLGLTIPAYRVDVTREADIVEEILRVYGYNNIAIPEKIKTSVSSSEKWTKEKIEQRAAGFLVSNGISEAMNNSLTKPDYSSISENLNEDRNVNILNALSGDLAVMRQSMLFGLLESLSYNINRKNSDLKLFEFGNTYHKFDSGYVENKHLSIALTGRRSKEHWAQNDGSADVFYLKGVIKSLLEGLGLKNLKYAKVKNDIFSEGLSLNLGKVKIVEFGVVKMGLLKEFGIKQEVLFADFDWNKVIENAGKRKIKISELPKYPEVRRDLALLLDENIEFIDLYNFAFQSERNLLKDVDLFDVYMGDKLPEGKKSYAMSFILQDDKKTLTDKQIDKIMNKLQEGFKKNFKADLR